MVPSRRHVGTAKVSGLVTGHSTPGCSPSAGPGASDCHRPQIQRDGRWLRRTQGSAVRAQLFLPRGPGLSRATRAPFPPGDERWARQGQSRPCRGPCPLPRHTLGGPLVLCHPAGHAGRGAPETEAADKRDGPAVVWTDGEGDPGRPAEGRRPPEAVHKAGTCLGDADAICACSRRATPLERGCADFSVGLYP